jgi:hypothetical protein
MGREQPNKGTVRMGELNILPNCFEQNQAEALDLDMTVLDTLVQVGGPQAGRAGQAGRVPQQRRAAA